MVKSGIAIPRDSAAMVSFLDKWRESENDIHE